MRYFIYPSLFCLVFFNACKQEQTTPTQDDRIAISLSYDDALESQLDHAIPALDKYGLKASFYLVITHPSVHERVDEWRAAARNGHELGNHTLFHPCSGSMEGRDWLLPHRDLDLYSMERLVEEVKSANVFLHAIDGKTERTYTPPCLDQFLGEDNYLEQVKDQFVGIKTYGYNQTSSFGNNDGYSVLWLPDGNTAEELIAYVESASKEFKELNLLFHGIGGDYMTIAAQEHEKFLKYLSEHQDTYYVDTYLNVCKARKK